MGKDGYLGYEVRNKEGREAGGALEEPLLG